MDIEPRQVDPTAIINFADFDDDLITDRYLILNFVDAIISQLLNVDHAVRTGQKLHKSADGNNAHHLPKEDIAD